MRSFYVTCSNLSHKYKAVLYNNIIIFYVAKCGILQRAHYLGSNFNSCFNMITHLQTIQMSLMGQRPNCQTPQVQWMWGFVSQAIKRLRNWKSCKLIAVWWICLGTTSSIWALPCLLDWLYRTASPFIHHASLLLLWGMFCESVQYPDVFVCVSGSLCAHKRVLGDGSMSACQERSGQAIKQLR